MVGLKNSDLFFRTYYSSPLELVFATVRASVHIQHKPHIMIVNRLEANKERFRPEGFDQIRPQSIRSLQLDQKFRPLSSRPEKLDLLTATPTGTIPD